MAQPFSIDTFNMIFYLTCFILVVKLIIIIFISVKIAHRGSEYALARSFMISMLILIISLLISRLFYMVFDFMYTKFDTDLYPTYAIWWKLGQLIVGLGLAYIVFVVDRKILQFKLKGIFAYIIVAGSVLTLLWPVSTQSDFEFISTIGILPNLGMLVLFFVFLNIARKTSGRLRTTAVIIILSFIFYAVAALAVNAGLIKAFSSAVGFDVTVYMYVFQTILKTIGIVLMAAGASRWGT